jgi:hypothetical protein
MAEDALINIQATDYFDLAYVTSGDPHWHTQASVRAEPLDNVAIQDRVGNVACERTLADRTDVTQTYKYHRPLSPDFITDLLEFASNFGDVQYRGGADALKLTQTRMTINMKASDYAELEIEGHRHAVNPHVPHDLRTVDIRDAIPPISFANWDGFGIPDWGLTLTNASPSSATLSFSVNHLDEVQENGDHLVGQNANCRVELTMDFVGIPDYPTASGIEDDLEQLGYLVDSINLNDSNADFDTFSFTAHLNLPTADVYGPELVTQGTGENASGWTVVGGSLSANSTAVSGWIDNPVFDFLKFTSSGGFLFLPGISGLTPGADYLFSFEAISSEGATSPFKHTVWNATTPGPIYTPETYSAGASGTEATRISKIVTLPAGCTEVDLYIEYGAAPSSSRLYFDNVSFRRVL